MTTHIQILTAGCGQFPRTPIARRMVRRRLRRQWRDANTMEQRTPPSREAEAIGRLLSETVGLYNARHGISFSTRIRPVLNKWADLWDTLIDREKQVVVSVLQAKCPRLVVTVRGPWLASDSILWNGRFYRREDTTYCTYCGSRSPSCGAIRIELGTSYCSNHCAEEAGYSVNDDGDWVRTPQGRIYDYNQYFCQLIGEEDPLGNLGAEIEIEFETRSRALQFVGELAERHPREVCHGKRDGSLSSSGVEIVTGYGQLKSLLPVVEDICNLARSGGGKSHNTSSCGLHISISRQKMTALQQAQFTVFWNLPDNMQYLECFTRRRTNGFSDRSSTKARMAYVGQAQDNPEQYLYCGSKYEIVNTLHRTHLEVRLFKGSINPDTVKSRLALVYLVAAYCQPTKELKQLHWCPFHSWVSRKTTRNKYPVHVALYQSYLERRGVTDPKKSFA